MRFTEEQTVTKIKSHIEKRGGAFKNWLIGTAEHAKIQLRRHGVKRRGDHWIYVHSRSNEVASKAQSHLVSSFGVGSHEGPGGDYVYAYKKATHTKP